MKQARFAFQVGASLVFLFLFHGPAAAQATRTWVSGVGDDANPGSRTAPCKTFAGAISKTIAGGEIDVIDPGGFGTITITKAITIDGAGTFASILGAGTTGVTVNAGVNDVVTIRNLSINGTGSGIHGIRFLAGAALHIENCVIANFTQKGVSFEPAAASRLFIKDTIIRNNNTMPNGGAVLVKPGAAGKADVTMDGVRMEGNVFAVSAQDRSIVTIRNSVAASNSIAGFVVSAVSAAAVMNLQSCVVSNHDVAANARGIQADGAQATIRISDVTVVNNSTGLQSTLGGNIVSFNNNRIAGNTTNGAPTTTTPQQ